jgi:protein ImuA
MKGDEQRAETLRALRQLCRGPADLTRPDDRPRLSTGIAELDALLPGGGLVGGSLVEWLAPVEGGGAASLALQGIRPALLRPHSVWAVVDAAGEFHSPAVASWGISLEAVLLLRPSSVADAAWTVEQCLRCPAVGVTWLAAEHLPDRVLRRWKIAAETGGGLGVLFRPARVARQASWADVRWLVQSRPAVSAGSRRLRVELLASRGAFRGGFIEVDVCDATGDVRVVSAVADPTTAVRAAGA